MSSTYLCIYFVWCWTLSPELYLWVTSPALFHFPETGTWSLSCPDCVKFRVLVSQPPYIFICCRIWFSSFWEGEASQIYDNNMLCNLGKTKSLDYFSILCMQWRFPSHGATSAAPRFLVTHCYFSGSCLEILRHNSAESFTTEIPVCLLITLNLELKPEL